MTKRRKNKKKSVLRTITNVLMVLLILALFVALAGMVGVVYWGNSILNSDTTLPNIYAGDIDLGSKTYDGVIQALKDGGWEDGFEGTVKVELPQNISFEVDYIEAGNCPDPKLTADAAMLIGHDGTWQDSLNAYLNLRKGEGIDVAVYDHEIDREFIRAKAVQAVEEFERSIDDSDFVLDKAGSTITLVKGAGEYTLDADKITDEVIDAIGRGESVLVYDKLEGQATEPDFAKLHEELFVEGSDAYYDPETNEVVDEVNGIDFDVDEATRLWREAGVFEGITIPITLYEPKITSEMLEGALFCDLLGEQTTYYKGSSDNRILNIGYAADLINGTILQPGDVFSFNGVVGQRTEERGFKYAGAYANGAVVQEIGGGICQVSSTIYAAMLRANLETVDRRCHTFTVSYLPMGIDATVSWPNCDFKFRNNTNYPVKLELSTSYAEKSITVKIWGKNETGNYCDYQSANFYVYDETYTTTQIGWGATSYRIIYDKDGNQIDRIYEGYSYYELHQEDIHWPEEYYNQQSGTVDIVDPGQSDYVIEDPPIYVDPTPEYVDPNPGYVEPTPEYVPETVPDVTISDPEPVVIPSDSDPGQQPDGTFG